MGEPCRKCKSWRPLPGDTWCVACSAWETIGLELVGHWSGPAGLRSIANDLVLGCAREVRALRAVGAGLGRAPAANEASPSAPVRARAPSPVPATSAKIKPGAPESDYTYEEYSEDEIKEKEIDKRPALVRRTPPPPGDGRPEDKKTAESAVKEEAVSEERRDKGRGDRTGKRSRDKDRPEEKSKKEKDRKEKKGKEEKKKKRRRRGGRKHQRLHTLGEDPFRPHHRKLYAAYLDQRDEL